MTQKLTLLMAQMNPTLGAINNNTAQILETINHHQEQHAIIVFPELALTGYPPEDLLFHEQFYTDCEIALQTIAASVDDCHVIIGHPSHINGKNYNSASVYYKKQRIALYHKQALPDYGVFDEKRYFTAGETNPCIFNIGDVRVALCICEDVWAEEPVEQLIQKGANILVSINASPFEYDKYQQREDLLRKHALRGLTIVYVNMVGGQDELVFDGQSFAMDSTGAIRARAAAFLPEYQTIILDSQQIEGAITPLLEPDHLMYSALVCGLRDYVEKNGFPGVLLGLSGGIDSALTLAIAVDALGASRVHAVMMPSRYTAEISVTDAERQLDMLHVKSTLLSIEPAFNTLLDMLTPSFAGLPADSTEENIQARIRGLLLMALSNKTGYMVLTTSNKSETAVGYATLYGDMAGGFSVLKDVLKTQVYALANYRNRLSTVIPERVISRPPTAELAANQLDQDSLPDYAILDAIITLHMERNLDCQAIIQKGFAEDEVNKVLRLIKRNEYKRRQAAPGIKISARAFGKDWRYPITSRYPEPLASCEQPTG